MEYVFKACMKDVLHKPMTLLIKIQYVFNKILLNFLKEIKNKDVDLKKKIKENYAVFDKSTNAHITLFMDNIEEPEVFIKPYEECDILENVESNKMLSFEILKNITVHEILDKISDTEKEVIKCYLYILYMLSYIYKKALVIEDDDAENLSQLNELFNKCLKMIKKDSDLSLEDELDNIFDEDLTTLFKNIFESRKHIKDSLMNDEFNEDEGSDDPMSFLQNSKIGKLAQEITQDIEIDKLNIKDPSELLNMESLLSGENSALGDIISKVGNKVAAKISSGELKHEDLLSEAMSMMGKLNGGGNNAFMEEMMKSAAGMNMTGMGAGPNLKPRSKNRRKLK